MPARPIPPKRHWRSYGDEPLPSAKEALEPFSAFPVVVPPDQVRSLRRRCGWSMRVHMKRGATMLIGTSSSACGTTVAASRAGKVGADRHRGRQQSASAAS